MRKIMLVLAFLGLLGLQVNAQKTVTGTVTSADDGSTLPGVSVVVKGTTVGTVTDIDGNYTLNVPNDGTFLIFSFVGMITQEVEVSGNTVNCVLVTEDIGLDEVVVTAIGIKRDEKSLGYSAARVGSEEFEKNSSVDAMNSLQGKVAGVSVTSGGGMPGSSTKVIIRGYSSLSSNNPLYVIDGVPIDNSSRVDGGGERNGLDFGNRANDINPNDIESMTILKGAAATALYGSRAANGVVVITTKSGSAKTGLDVEFNTSITTSDVLRLPQMQNTFGQGWSGHWADDENGSWGPKMDGEIRAWGNVYDNSQKIKPFSPVENNLYEFYDYGKQFTNSVSLSGGNDVSTFYMSYGNVTADGVVPTDVDHNVKNTLKFNGSTKGKYVTAGVSVSYVRRDGSLNPDGWGGSNSAANLYSELLQVPRDFSIVDFMDYKDDPFNTLDYFYTPYAFNPYYALNENQSAFFENRLYGNFSLDFKITDWITATYRAGVDASGFNRKEWEAIMRFTPGSVQSDKQVTENPGMTLDETRTTTEYNHDFIVSAQKDIGEMTLGGIVGFNSYQRDYKRVTGQVNTLVIPEFYDLSNTDASKVAETFITRKRQYAYYASFDFDYSDFIYLNITGRQEYSSTLPIDNNSFFYPSASVSFLVNEIVPAVDNFADLIKIRASWGQAGNDANPYLIDPVMTATSVWIPFGTLEFPLNNVGAFEKGNTIGNPELKPEITTEQEIGVDFRFFKNRLNIDAAYYNRISDGQILTIIIPASSGFSRQVINFGEVQNKGFELLLGGTPVQMNNFAWDITVNFTKNTNEVLDLPGDDTELILESAYDVQMVAIEGEPLGVLRAPDYLRDENGKVIVTSSNGIPKGTTEFTEIGTIQPDYILGLTNNFNIIKNLDLSFTIDYRPGGYFYSGTADLHYFVGNATQTLYNDRQPFIFPNSVKENPYYGLVDENGVSIDPYGTEYIENDVPIDMTNNNAYYYHSSNPVANRDRVLPRDMFKLREVSLSYTLPSSIVSKAKLQTVQVVLSGYNLWLKTAKENNFVDPEASSFGNDLTGEFGEFRTGPTVRSFAASLRVKF